MVRRLSAEPVGVPLGAGPLHAVVLGASTGGPPVVEKLLRDLPRDFCAAIALCQHMPPGFTSVWAQRLDGICKLDVKEANPGGSFEPGIVHVAPIGKHMRLVREDDGEVTIRLDADFADSLHVPSIDILMSSAAQAFGSRMLAVLMTGLGADGALGMLAVRRAGGHTLCQSADSALAYSMPGSAVELGAVEEEVSADEMAAVITDRVRGVL
ncbi:MAG: CheB methylesterase domain-containing protein [Coriobacteriia bacterium]|nr:CheB methylesterase domain-containing protein [Coriobacteriia bacterium]